MSETITKEREATSVYLRRVVHSEDEAVLSEERIKRDPVLVFTQPAPVSLDPTTGLAAVTVTLRLVDFDLEPRTDSGVVHLRIRDGEAADDEGVAITRTMADGEIALAMDFDAPGLFVVTVEPPFPGDLQLVDAIRVRVE